MNNSKRKNIESNWQSVKKKVEKTSVKIKVKNSVMTLLNTIPLQSICQ